MASGCADFSGQLKIVWDTQFKKNKKLRLVLCGSVSSWIEENILNSTDFMGRVSLVITLPELPLMYCNLFWGKRSERISTKEKLKILSITGGVPRYLEEINPLESAEKNIVDLCFTQSGLLFNEFDTIFHDIFNKRATIYKKITMSLVNGPRNFSEICHELRIDPNGVITKYLSDLESSGFVRKEYAWQLSSGKITSKSGRYRLSDNYVRFYLKYISTHAEKIKRGIFKLKSIEELPQVESIMGLQFENLILNNLPLLIDILKIAPSSIVQAGPYFQKANSRQKACQIDLLIQTKNTLYVCEVKFRNKIGQEAIDEVKQKIENLKTNKKHSIRPILIYAGELAEVVNDADYFDEIVDLGRFLEAK